MNEYATLVNSVFKIINFGIFIGLGIYLFYTKILTTLYQKMREQQAILPKLEQERRGLHNQEINIDTAIEQQALIAKVLQKKIEGWSIARQKAVQEQQKQHEIMQELIQKKAEKQEEYRAKNALYQDMIPEILATTQDALIQKYSQSTDAQGYLQAILHTVNKEQS